MIVASFLTKDLLIHWRKGESYFMKNLVDGDPASNIGGWQWAASTGTDAQPYFRVFNPWLQAEKFDQKGAYIRKWVPELARVPEEYIHNLGAMSPIMRLQTNVILGQTYPLPIVDHYAQKDIMLLRFKKIKS
jgi:deoxyribodipyrimidine photo-lyase